MGKALTIVAETLQEDARSWNAYARRSMLLDALLARKAYESRRAAEPAYLDKNA